MAKPIREFRRVDPTPAEQQAQALTEMIKALSDNRDAILDTLEILGHMHKMGILSATKSLLDKSHEVGVIAVQQFNQPKMHNTIKNVITAAQSLGSIQPNQLQKIFNGLSRGLETSNQVATDGQPPTVWELVRMMREPAVRTSVGTMLGLVKGMGEGLQGSSHQTHH